MDKSRRAVSQRGDTGSQELRPAWNPPFISDGGLLFFCSFYVWVSICPVFSAESLEGIETGPSGKVTNQTPSLGLGAGDSAK